MSDKTWKTITMLMLLLNALVDIKQSQNIDSLADSVKTTILILEKVLLK